ncbi:aminoglycoside phosphotransferase family protein [Paractinoplanes toevensis]|uniref:Aminoglycoside phosphotransferase n=1 Tax=Paractinoplanes toevensis TaxID=571911 RepID=A0A919THC2_9ACTN|nr:aminoglycoside phosphotransferase family protein [Actinoplanes toevensis]GIM94405.1 aminoglycoside phosphotransferase [Actinoplanes toevensis]
MSTTLTAEAAAELARGLAAVRQRAGLTAGDARLMRFTINAVYHLDSRVIRLARGEVAQQRAEKVVAGMGLLSRHDVPAVELVDDIAQPVAVNDWVATVWHYLPHSTVRPEPVELAAPLFRLHSIAEKPGFLPAWTPIETARRRLESVCKLSGEGMVFTKNWSRTRVGVPLDELLETLRSRCDDLEGRVNETIWELRPGVIHGDAHVGNLLAGRLCDFDSLALGPREWDLVPLAHSVVRFGDPVKPYENFAAAYGFDLSSSALWPLLRDVRELQLVTSVLDRLFGRPEVADTLSHRLRTYLAGDQHAVWRRYR